VFSACNTAAPSSVGRWPHGQSAHAQGLPRNLAGISHIDLTLVLMSLLIQGTTVSWLLKKPKVIEDC
jgi:hypothetical protein